MMSRTRQVHRLKILATTVGAALLVCGLLLAYASSPAWAADITVSTTDDELNDDGDCSLREAIEAADTNAAVDGCAAGSDTQRDTINFRVGQEATITLDSELFVVSVLLITDDDGLTITGQKKKITISGNDASQVFRVEPGAVFNLKNLTVADGNFFFGAGLHNNGGTVKVSNSTFSGNSASEGNGGAIENSGTMTVTNSTFSGNSGRFGGGIFNQGSLKVTNSTFSGNSAFLAGGGIANANDQETATLKNTIVANSFASSECFGASDGGYNLIEDGSCLTAATSRSGDPMLSDLAENGGPTQTMALQAGSKAIDKGKAFGATTDQRGLPRPVDFPLITNRGDGSDVGAFEVQP
jgi:CSLREA domain-containing protein